MDKKVVIYLADLANTKFGYSPSTVPVTIGYVMAYAISQLSNEVDIQLFRTFETLYKAIQSKEPDIVGCAWYGWNRWFTVNALKYIKSKSPNIVTVVGGANVPEKKEYCLRDFKEFPWIDVMIPNEGEIPFVNLLKTFIQGSRKSIFKTAIDGVFYLSDSRESVITGEPVPLQEDINIFPSPYLNGNLDEFLNGELMPILQTSRGCPFHCTFCVSAKDSWNRVRVFDTKRVKAEVDYLEANAKNRTIRFADENFGIMPRDLEIARFVAEKRAKTGYPNGLRAYIHKNINNRIKEITVLLRDLIPMNISTQTLTESVLNNINRKNISLDRFREVIKWAHKNSINVTTETIFGLPGESYESFMQVINQLVELRLDSICIGTLMMYKETEINLPDTVNKYGYKILFNIAERGYTKVDEFESVEIDAYAVESNAFSFEEYIRVQLFGMIFQLFMFCAYLKEMVYVCENRGVKITDVITELLDKPVHYSFFAQQTGRVRKCIQGNLFETKAEVCKFFSQHFSQHENSSQYIGFMSPFSLVHIIRGEMIHSLNQEKMIDEVIKAATAVFNNSETGSLSEFLEEMQFAKSLAQKVIIPFWEIPEEVVDLLSPYDLINWRNRDYRGALSDFILPKPKKYEFKIYSLNQYLDFIAEFSDKPFYMQSEFFFRTFRTNNVRRYIVSEQEKGQ